VSFKVTELVVGKGRTEGNEKTGWVRRYYEMKLSIGDEHDTEIAKASAEGLIDGWLTGTNIVEPQTQQTVKQESKVSYDPEKISWAKAEGTSGPYERSEDVNSLDFKVLLKDLAGHNGKFQHGGFFYWLFKNGSTIGRKPAKK
jgi:hypothetical protein